MRIQFFETPLQRVSVMAAQRGADLVPWKSYQGEGYDIAMLTQGDESPEDMISGAQSANTVPACFACHAQPVPPRAILDAAFRPALSSDTRGWLYRCGPG